MSYAHTQHVYSSALARPAYHAAALGKPCHRFRHHFFTSLTVGGKRFKSPVPAMLAISRSLAIFSSI
jgi:hypothetical protein